MTLTLDIAADLEHQILREARRRGLDAKSFVLNVLRESLTSHSADESAVSELSVSERSESDLLEEINLGFPTEVWERYRELVDKRQAETLSADEHSELIALIDRIEIANARRIECLAELATRRQLPLRTLMAEMGIQPSVDG